MSGTPAERKELGKSQRITVPREAHGEWASASTDRDPIAVLTAGTDDLLTDLLPIRWARMAESPFAFYRGSAAIMAGDLGAGQSSDLTVQLCGDAHLANFGGFATGERNLVFDLNDFDETLPGPFEWDVKRLAASIVIAGRDAGFGDEVSAGAAERSVRSYRKHMAGYAAMGVLDIWYSRIDVTAALNSMTAMTAKRKHEFLERALHRTSAQLLPKLTELTDEGQRIKPAPPLVVPLRDQTLRAAVEVLLRDYVDGVPVELQHVLRRFTVADVALKVVGVGSVGTRCLAVLAFGRDSFDPLFIQVKEAGPSALEAHLPTSEFPHHGQRVVTGQRLTQAAGDPFLGWASSLGRDFYVRQMRDMKISADFTQIRPVGLSDYAGLCGWALSRAHARTGDPIALSGYMGKSKTFDEAVTRGALRYADQAEQDHQRLLEAIADGRLDAKLA
jgi:uncharacterized protein (DUF2252 family)